MPKQSLLRVLSKHRSTPTLPSEEPDSPTAYMTVPSIFVTAPLDEGGYFWCLLPGSACPVPFATSVVPPLISPSGSTFDVPLPDFGAIEDTIDRLRRAGETPTFKRPSKAGQVVLPKKKAHGQKHHHQHYHNLEGSKPHRLHTLPGESTTSISEEISGSKLFQKVDKKRRKSRPPPLTSISYESIVSQSFSPSSPEAFHAQQESSEPLQPKEKKRSSIGLWFSPNKRASMKSRLEKEEADKGVQYVVVRTVHVEQATLQSPTSPISPGAQSTMTTESDLDKPLPPIPGSTSVSTVDMSPAVTEVSFDGRQDMNSIELAEYLSKTLPEKPESDGSTTVVEVNTESPNSTVRSKEAKPKRKFSLKRLRERFISSPTPPVPELRASKAIFGISGVAPNPIDPPFTPPSIPSVDSIPTIEPEVNTSESGPLDPPFTPPPIPSLSTEHVIAPLLLKDEETEADLSTSSEDSTASSSGSSAAESATSTPDSTPPDTPDHVEFGQVFGTQQEGKLPLDVVNNAIESGIIVSNDDHEGIPRSNGIRMKLASLHFDQMEFNTSTF